MQLSSKAVVTPAITPPAAQCSSRMEDARVVLSRISIIRQRIAPCVLKNIRMGTGEGVEMEAGASRREVPELVEDGELVALGSNRAGELFAGYGSTQVEGYLHA